MACPGNFPQPKDDASLCNRLQGGKKHELVIGPRLHTGESDTRFELGLFSDKQQCFSKRREWEGTGMRVRAIMTDTNECAVETWVSPYSNPASLRMNDIQTKIAEKSPRAQTDGVNRG